MTPDSSVKRYTIHVLDPLVDQIDGGSRWGENTQIKFTVNKTRPKDERPKSWLLLLVLWEMGMQWVVYSEPCLVWAHLSRRTLTTSQTEGRNAAWLNVLYIEQLMYLSGWSTAFGESSMKTSLYADLYLSVLILDNNGKLEAMTTDVTGHRTVGLCESSACASQRAVYMQALLLRRKIKK